VVLYIESPVVASTLLRRHAGRPSQPACRSGIRRDAQTIDFPVEIAADGEAKLMYTVRFSWQFGAISIGLARQCEALI
jgi:hypothetical protein